MWIYPAVKRYQISTSGPLFCRWTGSATDACLRAKAVCYVNRQSDSLEVCEGILLIVGLIAGLPNTYSDPRCHIAFDT